jgi:hypothetical protein
MAKRDRTRIEEPINDVTLTEIKNYSKFILSTLSNGYLEKNCIPKNILARNIFLTSVLKYKTTKSYELIQEEVAYLIRLEKYAASLLENIEQNKVKIISIDKQDQLILEECQNHY